MTKDSDRVKKEGVLGAWIGFIVTTIVMIVLTYALFWGVWQFWMWFAEMGTAIGVIVTSIFYYGRDSKKCPKCGTRMDYDVEYCKKCGTFLPSKCPECGAEIQANSAFCEKCGTNFGGKTPTNTIDKSVTYQQSVEDPMKGSQGNYKYCPACGNKTEGYAKHCSSCGIEL